MSKQDKPSSKEGFEPEGSPLCSQGQPPCPSGVDEDAGGHRNSDGSPSFRLFLYDVLRNGLTGEESPRLKALKKEEYR